MALDASNQKTGASRKVPVLRTANSLINDEFQSIRSRFDEEMRAMELEMERFKGQLLSGVRLSSNKTTSSSKVTTKTTNKTTLRSDQQEQASSKHEEVVSSPLVVADASQPGGQLLRLRFDLANYAPEQIVVQTVDNHLQVRARRELHDASTSVTSEYKRDFLLPSGTRAGDIKSTLSADGVLTIEAPLSNKEFN